VHDPLLLAHLLHHSVEARAADNHADLIGGDGGGDGGLGW
jgi:hypothetical protein